MRAFLQIGLLGIFTVFLFNFQGLVHAQTLDSLTTIRISLSPPQPQSGQLVTATVSSTTEDTQNATIVWLLDEEIQQQEAGGVSFSFIVGDVGSSQSLGVLVKTQSGQVITKAITIQPSQVTLLWEADTYTPPFYQGRSLYTSGSTIRAEAAANFVNSVGKQYLPSDLLYTWSKNGTVIGSSSGVNRATLVTDGPKFFGNYILSVVVRSPDGLQIARSSARIETIDPLILLYESDPLIGIKYHAAIGSNQSFARSALFEVQAVPYFMDTESPNRSFLNYAWSVNNTNVLGVADSPSTLVVQLSAEESIATRIQVIVDHAQYLLQTGRGSFNVTFEGSARNSLFGL